MYLLKNDSQWLYSSRECWSWHLSSQLKQGKITNNLMTE